MERVIVVADDEPHIRWLIEQTLEELVDDGVQLVVVGDGQAALEAIREHRPRLAILDVMMPTMTGFEVCEAVKTDEAVRDAYVIILTAKGQEYDRQRGDEVGANLYLTKPFDPDDLLATAREVLAGAP